MYKRTWWEKTVEYAFVKKHVAIEDLIIPLAGKHEAVGDAILGKVDKWLLIEFKRSENELNSEIEKFGGVHKFCDAKMKLSTLGGTEHHFLVYGQLVEETLKLDLIVKRYFERTEIDIHEALQLGVDFEAFDLYMKSLLELKNVCLSDEDGSDSGSSQYSRVVGVNKLGTVTECMSVDDYKLCVTRDRALRHEAELKLSQSQAKLNDSRNTTTGPKI